MRQVTLCVLVLASVRLAVAQGLAQPVQVVNGGMDEGGEVPAGWTLKVDAGELRLARDRALFVSSPASLRLESVGGKAKGLASQRLNLSAGQTVTVAGQLRAEGAVGHAAAVMLAIGGNPNWNELAKVAKGGAWQPFSSTFTAPPGTQFCLLLIFMDGEGKVWADDLSLTHAPTPPPAPLPPPAPALKADGADVVEVSPVTDRILLVTFSEGMIEAVRFQDSVDARAFHFSLLDVDRAVRPASYTLSSADDPAFGPAGVKPLHVGRKSKGRHFSKDLQLFRKGLPNYLSRHSLYLQLPQPLKPGKAYRLTLDGLACNSDQWHFVFDPVTTRSETIHLNQLGYRPSAPKYAYLSQFMGDFDAASHAGGGLDLSDYAGGAFRVVRDDSGQTVFSGTLSLQKAKDKPDFSAADYGPTRNFSRADVWQADFGALAAPGRYRLVVDRMGCSFPFEIAADVYREAYVTAMRGLFFQRSGIEKQVREYGSLVYPAGHANNPRYYIPGVGRKEAGKVSDTSRPVKGIWGWYNDAGDWDGYARHTGVPASLLLAYELASKKFGDGDIANRWRRSPGEPWVDEGANGVPDILDEAGWLLACYRRVRHALVEQGYGTGGVPSYMGIDACGKANASWLDERPLVVHGEDAALTAEYAGLAAWYGAALRTAGCPRAESDAWIAEAAGAYRWSLEHGAGGEEALLGAAGLYRATGEARYQQEFLGRFNAKANWEYWGGASACHFALFLYALLPEGHAGLDTGRQTELRRLVTANADAFWIKGGLTRGYRATHVTGYQRLFLGTLGTPRTLFPRVAHAVTGEARYADGVQFAADYALGGNQMNLVGMSGLGWRAEDDIFHPDSWSLLHFTNAAYASPTLPGLTPFGVHYTFDWFGPNYQFSGSENFSRASAYPVIWRKTGASYGGLGPAWSRAADIPGWAPPDSLGGGPGNDTAFPAGEQRFPNRYSIPGSEFTVNQTLAHVAFTYASLIDGFRPFVRPGARPEAALRLSALKVAADATVELSVKASANTARVDYYYGWHTIGSSAQAADGFKLAWHLGRYKLLPGEHRITARGYSATGLPSLPSEASEQVIVIGKTQ